jgi:hypothetical protein
LAGALFVGPPRLESIFLIAAGSALQDSSRALVWRSTDARAQCQRASLKTGRCDIPVNEN